MMPRLLVADDEMRIRELIKNMPNLKAMKWKKRPMAWRL